MAIGGAEGVEARRLAGRLRGGDRQHGLDAERPAVERLEHHGAADSAAMVVSRSA
jgi:hypothetical protein